MAHMYGGEIGWPASGNRYRLTLECEEPVLASQEAEELLGRSEAMERHIVAECCGLLNAMMEPLPTEQDRHYAQLVEWR